MRLPHAERAVVEDAKLSDYCLSTSHPRGKHKARLFASLLGLTASDAPVLKAILLDAARSGEALLTRSSEFGQFFEIRFPCSGPRGRAMLLSVWLIGEDDIPRLITVYPV